MYTSHTCATSIRSVAQVEDGKPFLLHKFINCYLILVIGVQVYEFIEQVIQLKNNCQELKLVEQIHILVYQLSIKMSKDDGRQIAWAILPIRESLNACGELVYLFDTGTCSKTPACIVQYCSAVHSLRGGPVADPSTPQHARLPR